MTTVYMYTAMIQETAIDIARDQTFEDFLPRAAYDSMDKVLTVVMHEVASERQELLEEPVDPPTVDELRELFLPVHREDNCVAWRDELTETCHCIRWVPLE